MNEGYQTPKVDDFGRYIFIIEHAIQCDEDFTKVDTIELNCFLGSNYLVTSYNNEDMPPIKALWDKLEKDERLTQNGADFLCYSLMDLMVDDYLPVLDKLDDEIEQLEDSCWSAHMPKHWTASSTSSTRWSACAGLCLRSVK